VLIAVDKWFATALDAVCEGREARDFKSLLQTDVQGRLKTAPKYRVVGESGPDHEKVFEVEVSINDDVYARSTGRSKKEAEQAAAEKALVRLSDAGA
jgi:ribonuclease III